MVHATVGRSVNTTAICPARSRGDENFTYVAAWEWPGESEDHVMGTPVLHKEPLTYEFVEMKQRSYK